MVMELLPNMGTMDLARICTNAAKSNACLLSLASCLPLFLSSLLSSCKYGAVVFTLEFWILYSFSSIPEVHRNDESLHNTKYLI